jgi:uncharacterized protein (TIGR02246 family)
VSDEDEIRAIIDRWERAVQDRDMEGTLAGHSPDVVMFDVPEPIQAKGIAAYRETWELFFANSAGGVDSFRLHEIAVTAGDTVAFVHALLDAGEYRCRLTTGLVKSSDGWLITHEHHSSPWPDPR